MSIMDWAAWCVIIGLSLVAIGGLLIWAYGDSVRADTRAPDAGAGVAARRRFTGVLIYSVVMIVFGIAALVQGTMLVLGS